MHVTWTLTVVITIIMVEKENEIVHASTSLNSFAVNNVSI